MRPLLMAALGQQRTFVIRPIGVYNLQLLRYLARDMTTMRTVHRIVLSDEYIAEAQRLTIAQNRTLRLMYQTWWVWWLPRVVIVGLLGFLLIEKLTFDAVLLGAFLVLSFFGELFSRRTLARARDRTRAKGSTTTLAMDENGIDAVGALGNTHLKWTAILPPAITPDGVLIRLSQLNGMWLPDKALVEGSPSDVRPLLNVNVKAS